MRNIIVALDLDDPAARTALRAFADAVRHDGREREWAEVNRLLATDGPIAGDGQEVDLIDYGARRRRNLLESAAEANATIERRRLHAVMEISARQLDEAAEEAQRANAAWLALYAGSSASSYASLGADVTPPDHDLEDPQGDLS